jgi:hypothetical protein
MQILKFYPSKYIRPDDLNDEQGLTIRECQAEEINGEQKPVLGFQEIDKGLVLNRTNVETIADRYGYETDNWRSKSIVLYRTKVEFRGKRVPAIRVRFPSAPEPPPITDDDIPF